jgi:hypothetical protein
MEDVQEMKLTRLFPVLSEEECAVYLKKVHDLREYWTRRAGDAVFYTLGAASYLDATAGRFEQFREMAVVTNPILRREFGPLIDAVLGALGTYVGDEVRIDDELSVPGFHVFLADEFGGKNPTASLHFDLQYENLRWEAHGGAEPETQISFTLPLVLPANGGGLLVWDLKWQETRKLLRNEHAEKLKNRGEGEYVAYQNGVLAVHGGHHLHQIAPFKDHSPTDERTTLQGHAIRCSDGWWAYW